jgi:hypothetical protein
MCDTQSMCLPLAVLAHPPERYPVASKRDVPRHLNFSRLKLPGFKCQTLTGLGGDPVGKVILANGRGTNRWPAQEIFVP